MTPKYPEVKVQLTGRDSNAFSILGRTLTAMRRAGLSEEERKVYQKEATTFSRPQCDGSMLHKRTKKFLSLFLNWSKDKKSMSTVKEQRR